MTINRREALKRVAWLMGGTISASAILAMEKGYSATASAGSKPAILRPPQVAIVSAVAEIMIPRTDTPGAIDTGVPGFIDLMLIKWMLAVAAATPGRHDVAYALGAGPSVADAPSGQGYGTDPNLIKVYEPGELWPLTFTSQQRRMAKVLCDLIIPADASSPRASAVGVVDFLDEWISAPYEQQCQDRTMLLEGFAWLDREAASRYGAGKSFVALSHKQQTPICDDICFVAKAKPGLVEVAQFFARYRRSDRRWVLHHAARPRRVLMALRSKCSKRSALLDAAGSSEMRGSKLTLPWRFPCTIDWYGVPL
jgi:hypothetical protein